MNAKFSVCVKVSKTRMSYLPHINYISYIWKLVHKNLDSEFDVMSVLEKISCILSKITFPFFAQQDKNNKKRMVTIIIFPTIFFILKHLGYLIEMLLFANFGPHCVCRLKNEIYQLSQLERDDEDDDIEFYSDDIYEYNHQSVSMMENG